MNWEPWSGCQSYSDGCKYCYFYGPYSKRYGQNNIEKTAEFDKPLLKNAKGEYKITAGKTVATCFATDFFIEEADEWRKEAWTMIKARSDLDFLILTKRIDRFLVSLPSDWGDGYDNVNLGCTVENQEIADYRLPLFMSYPIKRRFVACSPLLGKIDLSPYIDNLSQVTVTGESGRDARVCDFDWVKSLYTQTKNAGKIFWYKGTGTHFKKDNEIIKVNPFKQGSLAKSLILQLDSEYKD